MSPYTSATAQQLPPAASADTRADLRTLVTTLKDEARRKELIATLEQLLAADRVTRKAEPPASSILDHVIKQISAAGNDLRALVNVVPDIPYAWSWLQARASDPEFRSSLAEGLWKTAAIFLVGGFAAWLLARLLARLRQRAGTPKSATVLARVLGVSARTLIDLMPLAAFAALALILLPITQPRPATSAIVLTLLTAVVIARALAVAARAVLCVDSPELRLVRISNANAAYLYVWFKRIVQTIVYGYFGLVALDALYLPSSAFDVGIKLLGLVTAILLIVFVLQVRTGVAARIIQQGERRGWGAVSRRAAPVWHLAALTYIVAAFFIWVLDAANGFAFLARATFLTVLILIVARLLMAGIQLALDRLFSIDRSFAQRHPGLRERAARYLPAVKKVATVIVGSTAVLAVVQVWGIDSIAALASDNGQAVLATSASIIVVLLGALIVWAMIKAAIARYIRRLSNRAQNGQRVARIRTLMPMLEKAIFIALLVVTVLIVLAELGIDIGPMIAGAGVIGLAIGFGAQTLVKDIITGVFTVMEDSMAVGDLVTVAGRTGTVQDLTIRSVVLRDYYGIQHTIPFSAISDIQNLSKDFSFAVIDIGVSYRENVDDVIELIRRVGAAFRLDATASANVVDDLEVAGVHELADSAVVIRVRFKCLPGTQFAIRREMNRRIKAAFDEAGVEIPYPHRTLYFGEDRDGQAPAARLRFEPREERRPGDKAFARDPAQPELPLAAE